MPDSRTIIAVTKPFAADPDPARSGEIHCTLSDGSDVESGGIVERQEAGAVVQRVEIRIPGGLVDGPLYTATVCEQMRALGCIVPDAADVKLPVAASTGSAPAPDPIAAPMPVVPPTPAPVNIPVPAPSTPQEHASILHGALSIVHSLLPVLESPAVLALLPPQYRAYAMAITAVDQVATAALSDDSTGIPVTP